MSRFYQVTSDNKTKLAELLTQESGITIRSALDAVDRVRKKFFLASELHSLPPRGIQTEIAPKHGRIAGFLPSWNFPHEIVLQRIAETLFAGYPVVLKAPSETPLTYLSIAKLVDPYLPKGVLNVITSTGENEAAMKEVMFHTEGMCSFACCNSASFCKEVYRNDNILEYGFYSFPALFNDGDIDEALGCCTGWMLDYSGQWCNKMGHVLVQEGIYDRFVSLLANDMKSSKVGDPMNGDNRIGCLYNSEVVSNFLSLVDDAVSKGAKIVCGGKRHALGGTFVEPTVLADVNPSMRVFSEEIIGPLVPV